jgi:hypothetical protein
MPISRPLAAVAALLLAGTIASAQECDRFYVVVYGSQLPGFKAASKSHTWASFFRKSPGGNVEWFTISWLPVAGKVRPLALKPEPGRNYTFEETIQFNNENKMVTGFWGPYEIQPSLWEAAVEQREKLESGQVLYKANDQGSKDGTVSNCIHSVSIMVRPPGQPMPLVYVAPINWGESGSFWVTLALRPWFINPCCKHDELLQFLGPDVQCMKRHDLDRNPTRDPVVRATQALFQRKLLPNRVFCD